MQASLYNDLVEFTIIRYNDNLNIENKKKKYIDIKTDLFTKNYILNKVYN